MKKQTDNSYLEEKILLRIESLPKKQELKILEAFAGDSKIWDQVKKRTGKDIDIVKMDLKIDKKGIYLNGNNLKFLPSFDFSKFDVIDLDAYGSPYDQLRIVFEKKYAGVVHCTFIQSGMGALNKRFLQELGYSAEMQKKIKSIFNRRGMQKMEQYLAKHGVKRIVGHFLDRKNYFYFYLHN